jgi:amidase
MTAEFIREGALALSRHIRARRISCREVMAATLDRIEATQPTHNHVPTLRDRDALMAEAGERDAELDRGLCRGWLHGVPQAVKDLASAKGLRTTWGSPIFRDFVASEDSIHVARVKEAGAIVVGKTNTPEWGLGSHSYNPLFGTTRNAHDPALSAGGSSGGAAVALALGCLAVADGSDMGGSLRNPAGWNGVIGFRPSFGLVPSSSPDEAYMNQLSTDGPMGVTVEDVAALLATQAGYDPRAPLSRDGEAALGEVAVDEARGLRIGWLGDLGGKCPTEAGLLGVCDHALGAFRAMGAEVEPAAIPFDLEKLWDAWVTLRHFMVGGKLRPHYDDPARRALLKPEAVWEIEGSLALGAIDVYRASMVRTAWTRTVGSLFERHDLLALPSAQVFAFPAEWTWPKEIAGVAMDTYHRWMEIVIGPTMAGSPAISVPAGTDARGRHIGLQLWGAPRADRAVLKVAAAYMRASRAGRADGSVDAAPRPG